MPTIPNFPSLLPANMPGISYTFRNLWHSGKGTELRLWRRAVRIVRQLSCRIQIGTALWRCGCKYWKGSAHAAEFLYQYSWHHPIGVRGIFDLLLCFNWNAVNLNSRTWDSQHFRTCPPRDPTSGEELFFENGSISQRPPPPGEELFFKNAPWKKSDYILYLLTLSAS